MHGSRMLRLCTAVVLLQLPRTAAACGTTQQQR
jgi:hypothetical protein